VVTTYALLLSHFYLFSLSLLLNPLVIHLLLLSTSLRLSQSIYFSIFPSLSSSLSFYPSFYQSSFLSFSSHIFNATFPSISSNFRFSRHTYADLALRLLLSTSEKEFYQKSLNRNSSFFSLIFHDCFCSLATRNLLTKNSFFCFYFNSESCLIIT
jgi:hypothetical protein